MGSSRWTEADVAAYQARRGQSIPTLPGETPEGQLLAAIRRVASTAGWEVYHTYSSKRSEPGFPDVVLTDGESLLMMELKDNRGKPTLDQARWLQLLAHTGKVETGIWRPRDFPAIVARLTRGKAPCPDT